MDHLVLFCVYLYRSRVMEYNARDHGSLSGQIFSVVLIVAPQHPDLPR